MPSMAADNARAAQTNNTTNAGLAQRAPPETPDSERTSFHSARSSAHSIPAPKFVQVSNELGEELNGGPSGQNGTTTSTPRNTTPQGFERHSAGENKPPARRGTRFGRMLEILPDWLQEALTTSRAWKNWFRSMVAALAMMIIMVARKSMSYTKLMLTVSCCCVRGWKLLRLPVLSDDHTKHDDHNLLPRTMHCRRRHAARLGLGMCCDGGRHQRARLQPSTPTAGRRVVRAQGGRGHLENWYARM